MSRDPDRSAYDLLGDMLTRYGTALKLAREMGWINETEAAEAFRIAATGMGLGDFPGVDVDSLKKAEESAKAALDLQRANLSQQFPLSVAPTRAIEAEEDDVKKNAERFKQSFVPILDERRELLATTAEQAKTQAFKMAQVSARRFLGDGDSTEINLDDIKNKLKDLTTKPIKIDVAALADNSRSLIINSFSPWSIEAPSRKREVKNLDGSVEELDWQERIDRKTKDWLSRYKLKDAPGQESGSVKGVDNEWTYSGLNNFKAKVLELAQKAKEEGTTLQEFAGSLASSPDVPGSLAQTVADHLAKESNNVQETLMRRAEGVAMSDYAHAYEGEGGVKIKRRYIKISSSTDKCDCHKHNGMVYDVPGQPETGLGYGPKLPLHPYCRCKYLPMILGGKSNLGSEFKETFDKLPEEFEKTLSLEKPSIHKDSVFSKEKGYLDGYELHPARVAYLQNIGFNQQNEWDRVFNLELSPAKGIGKLSKYSSDSNRNEGKYIKHFSKDDWRERLSLFAPAMATLKNPDYISEGEGKRFYYARIQLGVNQPPIIMKVTIAKNREDDWFPLTWYDLSKGDKHTKDILEEVNSDLMKYKGKWLLKDSTGKV